MESDDNRESANIRATVDQSSISRSPKSGVVLDKDAIYDIVSTSMLSFK